MFYLDLVEYEKADSYSEEENILKNPVAGVRDGIVKRSSNQVEMLSWQEIIWFYN